MSQRALILPPVEIFEDFRQDQRLWSFVVCGCSTRVWKIEWKLSRTLKFRPSHLSDGCFPPRPPRPPWDEITQVDCIMMIRTGNVTLNCQPVVIFPRVSRIAPSILSFSRACCNLLIQFYFMEPLGRSPLREIGFPDTTQHNRNGTEVKELKKV